METWKQQLERATAEQFLAVYNAQTNSSYYVVQVAAAPDVICRDGTGALLQLEIVLLEDRPGDIQALRGGSNARSLERLKSDMERVRRGEISALDTVASFGQRSEDSQGTVNANFRAPQGQISQGLRA
jgi:hypothetical protein